MSKTAYAITESTVYHNEDMTRIAIFTGGWKSKIGGFACALVTFIDSPSGEFGSHIVRPFIQQTLGMRRAEHFAKTGEILGESGCIIGGRTE